MRLQCNTNYSCPHKQEFFVKAKKLMQISDTASFFDSISIPRINSYKFYFGSTLSPDELVACYQWNEAVSVSFFKLINLVEIVLRNKFHSTLSQHFFTLPKEEVRSNRVPRGVPYSYQPTATLGTSSSCNWYNNQYLANKTLQKVLDKTHHKSSGTPLLIPISPDDLVAGQTLGFWCSLISKNSSMPWDQLLNKLFPNHRLTKSYLANLHASPTVTNPWLVQDNVQRLSNRLELLNDFRNRIAHHEPIWKLKNLYDENPTSSDKKGTVLATHTTNKTETFQRLKVIHKRFIELLRWLDNSLSKDYLQSTNFSHLDWLISSNGFDSYIDRYKNANNSFKHTVLKRNLSSLLKHQECIYLHKDKRNIYALLPIN